jgi:toxin-antitoxin system PIN domain toxin
VSRALLDVNVLLALFDSDHVDHTRARRWLDSTVESGWASCAITQNGFIRVISQPRYPSPVSPAVAIDLLAVACSSPYHEYWPCDISLLDDGVIDATRLHGPRQVTDAYLLALAVHRGGRLATFDLTVALSAVRGATDTHITIL